jgi:hypothetical protein
LVPKNESAGLWNPRQWESQQHYLKRKKGEIMTQNTTDPAKKDNPLTPVSEITVYVSDVLTAIHHNADDTTRGTHVLRVSPSYGSFDAKETAELHRSESGRHYINYDGPDPQHLRPSTLLGGNDITVMPDLCQTLIYPREADDRDVYEDSRDNMTWNEWRKETLQRWRDAIARRLKQTDPIKIGCADYPRGDTTTVGLNVIDDRDDE